MSRAYPERQGSLRNSQVDANGARYRTGEMSLSQLVTQNDTINSRLPSGSTPTLTCTALKLTGVLYESPEQLGTVDTDA